MSLLTKLFGNYSEKEIKRITPLKDSVLNLESKYSAMTDTELKAQTEILKGRLANGETLEDILPDAFATCREAMWRVLGKKPYPVQVLGGIVLFQGRIAEMRTGEGKTFVAALPTYLVALSGKGVHVVTVNDYLAKRDGEMIGRVHRFLGLTVGMILHDMTNDQRRKAYNCDVTYGTNNELGFDYLRDNMCIHKKDKVQREFNFAIVDEVDSILIDEARTPLIISGTGDKSTDLYQKADKLARNLRPYKVVELDSKEDQDVIDGDYIIDEKAKSATLTQRGVRKAEAYFGVENLMDMENMTLLHHVNQAIKAQGIMKRDVDYVIKDGEIVIVDEFTGRLMFGRRFNEGLHQAIEAKEGVQVKNESKTLATITFQNFFRLYDKLSGMTGTAMTEEGEFRQIYALDVIEIPTNKPVARIDHQDQVYKNENGKFTAVIRQIEECHAKGQPVLVGTITIEKSELLSSMLKRKGIKHEVLNAKNHEREAEIVAQAGKKGAVTIATNMAGRGTDIMLGGNAEYLAKAKMRKEGMDEFLINEATGFAETDNQDIINARETYIRYNEEFKNQIESEAEEVRQAGGLFILGTERHESRRIDNQLRGRAGRQGDPGESRFFISLEDDLMRMFGGERVQGIMQTLGIEEDMPIENKFLTNTIESSQRKVEGRNFSIRKNVLDFDDVMSQQRMTIYTQRAKVLNGEDISDYIKSMIKDTIEESVMT
ncbi:MAG: preprotein translocase subunit SecA, partial [Ruminiclostridium sp.]|nr:preprotein translocase subunit SecA [Ruminiclostridium sp.]